MPLKRILLTGKGQTLMSIKSKVCLRFCKKKQFIQNMLNEDDLAQEIVH